MRREMTTIFAVLALATAGAALARSGQQEFWYDRKGLLNGKADVTLFGMK